MTSTDAGEDWLRLADAVRAWVVDDPDPSTADELAALLDLAVQAPATTDDPHAARQRARVAEARADLADRFSGLLEFGTAGLRGTMGGGPHRMNRAVVIRAAAGIAAFLNGALAGDERRPRIVIGYDARHHSARFAEDTAAVMAAVGIEALLLPSPLPTPVLAHAVRHLDADAGVMVTASHNPAQDNGYKVYLGGRVVTDAGRGAQIVPPYDAAIAAEIAQVHSVASVPRATAGWTVLGNDLVEEYIAAVVALADAGPRNLRIILTPLHGVGGRVASTVLRRAGFTDVMLVPEQADPDPDFSTVQFPNPEEPGAIDLALALAYATNADIVLANDPDADRCAVAVRDPRARTYHGADGARAEGWRMLHGDEVGALLGELVASQLAPAGSPASVATNDRPVLASSIVSSRLLARIAADHGLRHAATLTGFKWISRVEGMAFGYEEALGYCVAPELVRDKDGISAALLIAELAARLKTEGRTLLDVLDDLARRHDLHLTDQLAARFAELEQIPATVARIRQSPPTSLGGSPVTSLVDLSTGADGLPATDGLRFVMADDTRVVIRPSGTEPKVKCYLEVIEPLARDASDESVGAARAGARHRLDGLKTELAGLLGL
ncbi:MAG TPA: phospho-sugar mutase [Cellulomonadaceae bacterium]|nr:phospho-sugar mutase [Cellulomonadaceae bacterium]